MSELEEWIYLIKSWEKKYGKPPPPSFDLTEARMCCVKCGRVKKKMSRHHIENDLFFARMLPDVFAKQYINFLKEDVAKLCDSCHKHVHHLYKPVTSAMWIELNRYGQEIITAEWCIQWKFEYRKVFEKWVSVPKKKRRRRKKKSRLPPKPEDSH